MADYRLYCLSKLGNLDLAEVISAESDEEAVSKARGLKGNVRKCEVWRGNRLVASFGSQLRFD